MLRKIEIKPASRFKRSYLKLPAHIQRLAVEKEAIFANNPFDSRLKTHKLKGKLKRFWSFSISHSYRILFEFVNQNKVIFYDIGDHKIYQ